MTAETAVTATGDIYVHASRDSRDAWALARAAAEPKLKRSLSYSTAPDSSREFQLVIAALEDESHACKVLDNFTVGEKLREHVRKHV